MSEPTFQEKMAALVAAATASAFAAKEGLQRAFSAFPASALRHPEDRSGARDDE